MDLLYPFKNGGYAESRSFIEGYRGAWFESKINCMRVSESGHFEYYLEYTEYPEEDKEWIRLFENNPACSKQKIGDQIMLRPSFPKWYRKDKVPKQLPDRDVIAIVDEAWKVGDRVDWFCKGSHWSGRITKLLLNKNKVKVELLQPPMGEGELYEANVEDLRPTLDWSLERGWTVPLSQAKGESWHAARVIHRKSAESETSSDDGDKDDNGGDGGDSQDVQLHMISLNTSLGAPDSPIPKPSSAAKSMSSLNAQKDDDTLRPMTDLQSSSSSKSRAPGDGVQLAVTSSQPSIGFIEQERGMGCSIEQDQAGTVQDQYLQKLAEGDGNLKELLERTLSLERRAALLCSFHWAQDDASVKTK